MPYSIILHLAGEEPVVGEVDELPKPIDQVIAVNNPRRIDGKDLHYLAEDVTTVYWPITRLNFIEVMPSKEEEHIIGFVRD
ncbi:MAG TPA: hypothetical protein PKM21_04605 [Anaerolineales bacterium]|nr:hypothetical protein [Anaerolineales bacterium]